MHRLKGVRVELQKLVLAGGSEELRDSTCMTESLTPVFLMVTTLSHLKQTMVNLQLFNAVKEGHAVLATMAMEEGAAAEWINHDDWVSLPPLRLRMLPCSHLPCSHLPCSPSHAHHWLVRIDVLH